MLRGSRGRYPYNRGKHLIAAIELFAYGDESGMHGQPKYCLLLGYLGSLRQWSSFNQFWSAALSANDVTEFHAIDFFHRSQSRSNPFRDWSEERRRGFLSSLLQIIFTHRILPIGGAVDVNAFNLLREDERRYLTGAYIETKVRLTRAGNNTWNEPMMSRKFKTSGAKTKPYLLAFHHFFTDAWALMPRGSRLNLVLDRQGALEQVVIDTCNGYAKRWNVPGYDDIRQRQLGDITYADSSLRLPLQAADLYVYAWGRAINGSLTDELRFALRHLTAERPGIRIADAKFFQEELTELRQGLADDSMFFKDRPVDNLEEKL